jgi:peptidoglycan-associated lipoprotein
MKSVRYRWLALGMGLGLLGLMGCGGDKPPETPASKPTAGTTPPATPEQDQAVAKAADENQGGGLSISPDIMRLCPGIKPPKFGYNSSEVKDEWRDALSGIADCMKNGGLKGKGVLLTGHTDPRGDDDYNVQLGGRRAEAVKSAISAFGVENGRIDVTSRGEADAKGTEESSWVQDRRVDISLKPGGG